MLGEVSGGCAREVGETDEVEGAEVEGAMMVAFERDSRLDWLRLSSSLRRVISRSLSSSSRVIFRPRLSSATRLLASLHSSLSESTSRAIVSG